MRNVITLGGPIDGQVHEVADGIHKIVGITPSFATGGTIYPDSTFIPFCNPLTPFEYEEREKDIFYYVES